MTIDRLLVSDWSCIWRRRWSNAPIFHQSPRFTAAKTRNFAQHVTLRFAQQCLSPPNL